jgi:cytoskeletal protein RodZ
MSEEEKKSIQSGVTQKEERDKHNALLTGVIFFMILIIVLWVINLKTIFTFAPAKQNDQLNVDQLTQDFQQAFNEAGTKMDQLKKINDADLEKYAMQPQAFYSTSSTGTAMIKK